MAEKVTHTPQGEFHAHLDVCEQCRNCPFNLCRIGDRLIVGAFKDACDEIEAAFGMKAEAK